MCNKNVFSLSAGFRTLLLTAFIMLSAGSLSAQDVSLTIKADNAPLKSVMMQIESQTKYLFVYDDQIDVNATVNIDVKKAGLEQVLSMIFRDTGIAFKVSGMNVILSLAAQENKGEITVLKGKVYDRESFPVIGAGIFIEGTAFGTTSDLDGNFSFEVPSEKLAAGARLSVSCLGYKGESLPIGGRTYFEIVLEDDSMVLDGTVVTALGIKRSEKALSYNVQKVDSDELLANKDANFVNSLNGKVAGLVINASSSGVGGASKVVMRGSKSISKSSNALYVIDGVPMYTSARDGGTEFDSRGTSDPIADINPEDIESMTVLTGAAAAALYGSDAANGAIVVTTKKGIAGKTSITVSSNTEIFSPFVLPDFQNRYGTGDISSPEGSLVCSWGLPLNAYNSYGYSPRKDYFRTGVTQTENISFSTGNDKNQTYVSVAAVNSMGNVPNNAYNRYNITGRNTSKFFDDKFTLDIGASCIMQDDRNMTNQGLYNNPVVGAYLFPRGDDWNAVRMYERFDPSRKIYSQYWPAGDGGIVLQNPYWINYRNLRENHRIRYMLNASLSWQIQDWISLSGRIKADHSGNRYEEKFNATTNDQLTEHSRNGLYAIEKSEDRQIYADVLLDINKSWGDWSLHANAGASVTDMKYDCLSLRGPIADGIVDPAESPNVPNIFNVFALSQSKTVKKQDGWREQTQSVYASAEVGYKGAYYLTVTGRNDWPSQLAGPRSGKRSFFYPSVGLSAVLDRIIPMPKQIEYLKVRASYASVGAAFERYVANPLHHWPDKASSWATQTSYPIENLLPEKTNSWEVGLSARFLEWFSLEATWYNTHTLNQTIYPEISTGSGFSEIPIQSGDVRNSGFELSLGFDKSWGKFNWSSSYTFSTNSNRIISLAENAINPVTGELLNISSLNMGGLGNVRFILKEGGSLGDIYSRSDLVRDEDGKLFVNEDGSMIVKRIAEVDSYVKLGSVLPKANMAWRNDFRIGNWSAGFMLTARIGGVVYSRTQAMLDNFGVSEASAAARDNGGVYIDGSLIRAEKWFTAIGGGDTVPQYYTYSATNVRLQEAAVGYTIPRKALGDVCEITLQLVGRNLLMIYSKAPFDPESIAVTGNYYQGIDYFMTPSTRNFGFNVRIKF